MITCPQCHRQSPAGATSCAYCGARLTRTGSGGPAAPATEAAPAQPPVAAGYGDFSPPTCAAAEDGYELSAGDRLGGKYEIIQPLRRGGMAEVYKAKVHGSETVHALKLLPSRCTSDRKLVERFRYEATQGRALDHPNIIRVLDYREEQAHYYLVMELAPGWRASHAFEALDAGELPKPLDDAVLVTIIKQACEGLAYVHQRGIIHRDIKPSNLLLCDWGRVKLADFGIARSQDAAPLTAVGLVVGTPEYMSPEQVEGTRELTPASDIYSLGVVMYELLTSTSPFRRDTPFATAIAHLRESAPPPRGLNSAIPDALQKIVLTCLEKAEQNRYHSAQELFDALLTYERHAAAALLPGSAPVQVSDRGGGTRVFETAAQQQRPEAPPSAEPASRLSRRVRPVSQRPSSPQADRPRLGGAPGAAPLEPGEAGQRGPPPGGQARCWAHPDTPDRGSGAAEHERAPILGRRPAQPFRYAWPGSEPASQAGPPSQRSGRDWLTSCRWDGPEHLARHPSLAGRRRDV